MGDGVSVDMAVGAGAVGNMGVVVNGALGVAVGEAPVAVACRVAEGVAPLGGGVNVAVAASGVDVVPIGVDPIGVDPIGVEVIGVDVIGVDVDDISVVVGVGVSAPANTITAWRTAKRSSADVIKCMVRPSGLIHLDGKRPMSPDDMSHRSV